MKPPKNGWWTYPIYPKQDDETSKDRCGNPPTKNNDNLNMFHLFFTAYGGVLWSIGVPKWGGIPKSSSHPVIHTILVEQKPNDFGFQAGVDRPGQ
jgi:hypothetical protein